MAEWVPFPGELDFEGSGADNPGLVVLGPSLLAGGVVGIAISDRSPDPLRRAGIGMTAAGGVATVAGIALMLVGRTIVDRRRGR